MHILFLAPARLSPHTASAARLLVQRRVEADRNHNQSLEPVEIRQRVDDERLARIADARRAG